MINKLKISVLPFIVGCMVTTAFFVKSLKNTKVEEQVVTTIDNKVTDTRKEVSTNRTVKTCPGGSKVVIYEKHVEILCLQVP